MPHRIRAITALVAFVALVALAYTQRVRLAETWERWNRPSVPAVTYREVTSSPSVIARDEVPKQSPSAPPRNDEGPSQPEAGPPPAEKPSELPSPPPAPPTPPTPPASFNLAVPFTPQAPFANWDDVHEETCEEASLYMVHLYYQGTPEGLVAPATAENDLLKIVEAEKKMFGYFEDTTAEETARFIREYYGYARVDVVADPTVEDIKTHVAAGRPVIVPAAGRLLGNPYFTPPGPVYHMLVVRGYTPEGFIVNDPGTKRGEAFFYSFDAIMNAMHDWDPEEITDGRKAVIVIYK